MSIDIGRTAFRGFKLIGEKPWVLLAWGGLYLLAMAVLFAVGGGLMFALGGSLTAARDANGMPAEPAAVFAIVPFVLAAALAITSVFLCGVYRMVLKPSDKGLAYLKFGGEEFRMMGLLLLAAVIWIGVYIGVVILNVVMAAVTLGIGLLLTLPLGVAVFAFMSVKMSLAGVINFAEDRLGISESWALTRNNFWNLFVVYLILFVIWFVVAMVLFGIQSALQASAGMPTIFTALQNPGQAPTMPHYDTGMLIATLVSFVISMIVNTANMLVLYAPHAEAYLQLKPRPVDQTVETFS
jgi:hypothetical protein